MSASPVHLDPTHLSRNNNTYNIASGKNTTDNNTAVDANRYPTGSAELLLVIMMKLIIKLCVLL